MTGPRTRSTPRSAAEDPAEEARGLRAVLGRQAVDTRPLRIPEYRRILIGQGTSFIGSMLTQVAVPVQIWALTQSPLYVGFVGLAGLVPIVVFGLYGGAIADAVDRRVLYLWSSIGGWVVTLALLVQTLLDLSNVWLILALVFVQSGMFAVASSSRGAIIPRIVPTELVPAANTLNFTVGNVGQVAGPLIAGLLLVLPNGFALAYAADALLFTAALYSVLKLPSIPPQGEVQRPDWRAVAEGLRFIALRPVLVMSFAVDIAAMVLAMPRSLFPAVADARFGGQVGPLYAAIAIGAVVAGLSSGWIGRVRRQGRALTLAIVGWGAAVAVSGPGRPALAGRRPAGPRRRVRPGQRRLPPDHPPDLRPRRDARPDAGRLHRRRRRRPAPRRRPRRRHRRGDHTDLLVGGRRRRLHGGGHRRGPDGPVLLALRHRPRPALHGRARARSD